MRLERRTADALGTGCCESAAAPTYQEGVAKAHPTDPKPCATLPRELATTNRGDVGRDPFFGISALTGGGSRGGGVANGVGGDLRGHIPARFARSASSGRCRRTKRSDDVCRAPSRAQVPSHAGRRAGSRRARADRLSQGADRAYVRAEWLGWCRAGESGSFRHVIPWALTASAPSCTAGASGIRARGRS